MCAKMSPLVDRCPIDSSKQAQFNPYSFNGGLVCDYNIRIVCKDKSLIENSDSLQTSIIDFSYFNGGYQQWHIFFQYRELC